MELPHLGQHCSNKTCNQLDFLPVKCDACNGVFCNEHFTYDAHQCPDAHMRDNQVPVCPLCNIPIPVKRGELPDIPVGRHIDTDCTSEVATSSRDRRRRAAAASGEKVFKNKCSLAGCKGKEMIPCLCDDCGLNYCLKHRHQSDHKCDKGSNARQRAAQAAATRYESSKSSNRIASTTQSQSIRQGISSAASGMMRSISGSLAAATRPAATGITAVQGNMSEDEALARALHESLNPSGAVSQNQQPQLASSALVPRSSREEDEMLARALAESERAAGRSIAATGSGSGSRSRSDKCSIA